MRSNAEISDAAVVLLRELIDYAGLFPPASLSMAAAVGNYDKYLQSEWSWMLGRFIVPVARLAEFEGALTGLRRQEKHLRSGGYRFSSVLKQVRMLLGSANSMRA